MNLTNTQIDQLHAFTFRAEETGESKFPGMSYEEGIKAVLDVLDGNISVEDATGENE